MFNITHLKGIFCQGHNQQKEKIQYFIPCLTPSSVKKWQKREFPISQKIFSSQKNENNSHDKRTLENYNQQKNCECQINLSYTEIDSNEMSI